MSVLVALAVGWTFTARPQGRQTEYAVTGHPRPDARSSLRPGELSLRCTDKDKRLRVLYVAGTPGDGGPLLIHDDDAEPILYYPRWETTRTAWLPPDRLLATLQHGRELTIAVAGSPEHYDLPPLAGPLADLAGRCDVPKAPSDAPGLPPVAGQWTRRAAIAADGRPGVLLSLRGDNSLASLRVRCRDGAPDVYVAAEGGSPVARNQAVALQLDSLPVEKVLASAGPDGRALYFAKPGRILQTLPGHARLNVTFTGPDGNVLVESFDLAGSEATLAPWSEACGLRK